MKRRIFATSLIVLGAVFLLFFAYQLLIFFLVARVGESTPPSLEVLTTDTVVSETKPIIPDSYTVPAEMPRRISIPSIQSESYLQFVGVTTQNTMATPNNIFYSGWYVDSVKPGDEGVSIINGHAGGRYVDGVFRNLSKLQQNDRVRVEMGDRRWLDFKVEQVETVSVEEAQTRLYADDPLILRELKLITCDGVFNERDRTYDRRVIVTASLDGVASIE